jgi:hypothetical protein
MPRELMSFLKKYLHSRTQFYQKWSLCDNLSMTCHTVIIYNDIGWIVVFLLFVNASINWNTILGDELFVLLIMMEWFIITV